MHFHVRDDPCLSLENEKLIVITVVVLHNFLRKEIGLSFSVHCFKEMKQRIWIEHTQSL